MTLNDPLANVLSHILLEDQLGKKQITVKPNSKMVREVLKIMHENKYLGEITPVEDGKGGKIKVNLLGSINKVGVIKPRYSVKLQDYEKFIKRYLPALGFGFLIVSTNQKIMTHEEAIKKRLGGKLIAYVY